MKRKSYCCECDMKSLFRVDVAVREASILQTLEMCRHEGSSFEFAFVEEVVIDLESVIWVIFSDDGIGGAL